HCRARAIRSLHSWQIRKLTGDAVSNIPSLMGKGGWKARLMRMGKKALQQGMYEIGRKSWMKIQNARQQNQSCQTIPEGTKSKFKIRREGRSRSMRLLKTKN